MVGAAIGGAVGGIFQGLIGIGGALISSDASKYQINKQTQTQITIANQQGQIDLKKAELAAESQNLQTSIMAKTAEKIAIVAIPSIMVLGLAVVAAKYAGRSDRGQ